MSDKEQKFVKKAFEKMRTNDLFVLIGFDDDESFRKYIEDDDASGISYIAARPYAKGANLMEWLPFMKEKPKYLMVNRLIRFGSFPFVASGVLDTKKSPAEVVQDLMFAKEIMNMDIINLKDDIKAKLKSKKEIDKLIHNLEKTK